MQCRSTHLATIPNVPRISSPAIQQLEKLRRLRGNRSRDVSIASAIEAAANAAAHTQKKLGELIELWECHVPSAIANHTTLTGVRAGVLHVTADSSSAAFELDRILRGGLINDLRRGYRGTLTRVRVKIASESGETKPRSGGAMKRRARQ
jgi:hypothetical protein